MAKRYEDRYGRGSQRRDRGFADDRGYIDRASDEVRSWFGDDDAERRRHMDERRDRAPEARYRTEARGDEWSRSEWPPRDEPSSWPRSDYRHAQWERHPGDRSESWRGAREDRARTDERVMHDSDWPTREPDWRPRYSSPRYPAPNPWSADDGRIEFGQQRWGRGPKGYQRSDTRIHEEVCDRLTYSDVDAENVEVAVANGEVTLSGFVRERWDKRLAEDLTENVPGVREVHNSIRVTRGERGIGQSDTSATDQPGTVLGVNPIGEPGASTRRRS